MRKLVGTRLVLALIAATSAFAGTAGAQGGLVLSPGDTVVVTKDMVSEVDEGIPDGRDGFVEVSFTDFSFPYFGETYTTLFVQINGCISFLRGFSNANPPTMDFVWSYVVPTIAPLWSDFDLDGENSFDPAQTGSGALILALSADGTEFTVTWQNLPYHPDQADPNPQRNTFSATLHSDGTIDFNYTVVGSRPVTSYQRWIVGVTPGGTTPGVFTPGAPEVPSVILDLTTSSGPFTYGGAQAKYDYFGAEAGTGAPTFLGGRSITFVPKEPAELVAYYDMAAGGGNPDQAAGIETAGLTATGLQGLTADDLDGVDVLLVENPDPNGYAQAYLDYTADIEAAVEDGMVLILQDRYVAFDAPKREVAGRRLFDAVDAATILPGGPEIFALDGATFHAVSGDDVNIALTGTVLTDGPGGTLDDSSLDGGSPSYYGYADRGALPPNAIPLFTTDDPDQVVAFAYPYGEGWVIYSTIFPGRISLRNAALLLSSAYANYANIYIPNLIAYAASLYGPVVAPAAANQAPDAHNMILLVREDEPAVARFSAEDPDGDPLTFRIVSNGRKGSVEMLDAETGEYRYTPKPDVSGTDLFRYKAVDPDGASDTATVIVLISATNDAPTAEPVELATGKDTPLEGYLLGTDPEGAPLDFEIFQNGTLGTAVILDSRTGFFRYTPNPDATGTDTFWFTVSDGTLTSTPVPVIITIAPRESASTSDGTSATGGDDSSGGPCFIQTLGF